MGVKGPETDKQALAKDMGASGKIHVGSKNRSIYIKPKMI